MILFRRRASGEKYPIKLLLDDERVIIGEEELQDNSMPHSDMPDQHALNKIMPFFSKETPCFFDGCEEMREAYYAELQSRGGDGCPGCVRGAINRKYIQLVRDKLQQDTPL